MEREDSIMVKGKEIFKDKKKISRTLITIMALIIILLIAVMLVWFNGRSDGMDKYEEKIAELEQKITVLEDEKKKLMDEPIVVNPIAPEIKLDVIKTDLKEIGELATVEYLYTNAGIYEDVHNFLNIDIPFTKKTFTMKWDGVIKAGIDVNEIDIVENKEEKSLLVTLPKARILSHTPDRESVEVLNEKDGLFNRVHVEDQTAFESVCDNEMEQRAIENGILDKAQENAKNLILNFLEDIPSIVESEYKIEFEVTD